MTLEADSRFTMYAWVSVVSRSERPTAKSRTPGTRLVRAQIMSSQFEETAFSRCQLICSDEAM
jgi:hypothetical protein